MNYRTLRVDELERLAYLGDQQAIATLGVTTEMVPIAEAETEAADAEEQGMEAGYKDACSDIFRAHAEAILSASNGNRDADVCESLKVLMTFLEENQ
jgi:hypothetical protein